MHTYLSLPEGWTCKLYSQAFVSKTHRNTVPITSPDIKRFFSSEPMKFPCRRVGRHCMWYWHKRRGSISRKGRTQPRRLGFLSCSPQDWGKGLGLRKARWRKKLPWSGLANALSPQSETSSSQPSLHAFESCAEPRIWTICARSPQ